MRRLTFTAALLLAPALAAAQSVGPVPEPDYEPDFFRRVTGAYAFDGCATGILDADAENPPEVTTFCLAGRVTAGEALNPFTGSYTSAAWLTTAVQTHPAITGGTSIVTFSFGGFDWQTDLSEPGGGASSIPGWRGTTAPFRLSPGEFGLIELEYGVDDDIRGFSSSVSFTPTILFERVSTVPEPGTWALVGVGIAGVVGVARRRVRR
jgi:hypothetical protein